MRSLDSALIDGGQTYEHHFYLRFASQVTQKGSTLKKLVNGDETWILHKNGRRKLTWYMTIASPYIQKLFWK